MDEEGDDEETFRLERNARQREEEDGGVYVEKGGRKDQKKKCNSETFRLEQRKERRNNATKARDAIQMEMKANLG